MARIGVPPRPHNALAPEPHDDRPTNYGAFNAGMAVMGTKNHLDLLVIRDLLV
jgi:hypothetical protein